MIPPRLGTSPLLLILLTIAAVPACTTIKVDHNARTSLGRSPETMGGGQYEIRGQLQGSNNIELAEATFDPIFGTGTTLSTDLTYNGDFDILVGGGASVLNSLDMFIDAALDSPLIVGVQWQFFGASAAQLEPGFKASLVSFVGYHTETDDSSDVKSCSGGSTSCTTAERIRAEHKAFQSGGSIIIGHRLNEKFLAYLAPLYLNDYTWGSLVRANGQNQSFKNRSEQYSLTLGGEIDFMPEIIPETENRRMTYLRAELNFARISNQDGYGYSDRSLTLNLGFRL